MTHEARRISATLSPAELEIIDEQGGDLTRSERNRLDAWHESENGHARAVVEWERFKGCDVAARRLADFPMRRPRWNHRLPEVT